LQLSDLLLPIQKNWIIVLGATNGFIPAFLPASREKSGTAPPRCGVGWLYFHLGPHFGAWPIDGVLIHSHPRKSSGSTHTTKKKCIVYWLLSSLITKTCKLPRARKISVHSQNPNRKVNYLTAWYQRGDFCC